MAQIEECVRRLAEAEDSEGSADGCEVQEIVEYEIVFGEGPTVRESSLPRPHPASKKKKEKDTKGKGQKEKRK